jgi:hypothetical protein
LIAVPGFGWFMHVLCGKGIVHGFNAPLHLNSTAAEFNTNDDYQTAFTFYNLHILP